ncbi:MAG: VOC family protein [Deltaproteobacteria bacterium]
MMIKKMVPDLVVDDVNSLVKLYKEDLGFETVSQYPRWGSLQWALLENKQRDMQFMFEKRTTVMEEIAGLKEKAAGGRLTYYAEVDDIDGVYEKLKDRMKMVTDIYATSYGMDEFVAQDREGYVIVFGERTSSNEQWECF